jgi:hypothetical protein
MVLIVRWRHLSIPWLWSSKIATLANLETPFNIKCIINRHKVNKGVDAWLWLRICGCLSTTIVKLVSPIFKMNGVVLKGLLIASMRFAESCDLKRKNYCLLTQCDCLILYWYILPHVHQKKISLLYFLCLVYLSELVATLERHSFYTL